MKTRSALVKRRWWSLMLLLSLVLAGSIRAATAQDAGNTTYLPVVAGSTTTEQQEDDALPASDLVTQPVAIPDTAETPSTVQSAEANAPSYDRNGNFTLSGRLGVGTETPTINAGPALCRINDFRNYDQGDPAFTFFTRGWQVGALFFEDANKNRLRLRAGPGIPGNGGGNGTNDLVIEQAVSGDNIPLYIASNGNVGIGTTAPGEKLEVAGSAVVNGFLYMGTDLVMMSHPTRGDGGRALVHSPNNNDELYINYAGSFAGGVRIDGPTRMFGNAETLALVGVDHTYINFFPDGPQTAKAWIGFGDGNTNNLAISNQIAGANIILSPNGGNVGIGTFAPTALLSVNGTANKPGGGTWAAFSDERIKKNVTTFADGLGVLMEINPVRFQYNGLGGYEDDGTEYVGVLAQEVEQIAPYMVSAVATDDFADQPLYDGSAIPYILVNAVQEQQAQIEALQNENA